MDLCKNKFFDVLSVVVKRAELGRQLTVLHLMSEGLSESSCVFVGVGVRVHLQVVRVLVLLPFFMLVLFCYIFLIISIINSPIL